MIGPQAIGTYIEWGGFLAAPGVLYLAVETGNARSRGWWWWFFFCRSGAREVQAAFRAVPRVAAVVCYNPVDTEGIQDGSLQDDTCRRSKSFAFLFTVKPCLLRPW